MSERGQALVEFALVLPFLLAFALAIALMTEIGVARLALEHAAAEAARIGSLTNDDEDIRRAALAAVAPIDAAAVTVRIEPGELDPPRDHDPRGSILFVTLEHSVAVPLGIAGLPGVTVRARAVRVMEWTP
ncbi:MAG: TadE/TadG family type IV pilus assembly protein [Candidatus Limnocylindria bacterium]